MHLLEDLMTKVSSDVLKETCKFYNVKAGGTPLERAKRLIEYYETVVLKKLPVPKHLLAGNARPGSASGGGPKEKNVGAAVGGLKEGLKEEKQKGLKEKVGNGTHSAKELNS